MDFTKEKIVVKVEEEEEGDKDDKSLSSSYTADIKCPECNNVYKAFYKSYTENKNDKTVILPKRWYFNNFIRHFKSFHLSEKDSEKDENSTPSRKLSTKRKHDDPKQPKIIRKFEKIDKPQPSPQPEARPEARQADEFVEEVNLLSDADEDDKTNHVQKEIDKTNDASNEADEDEDEQPIKKKSRKYVAISSDSDSGED